MLTAYLREDRVSSSPASASAADVAKLWIDECERDRHRVALPRAHAHVVVRFGPSTRHGLDVYAMGVRRRAHRKIIRAGQRTVMARLAVGMHEPVLGIRARDLADRIVPLDDLWGHARTRRLTEQLADATDVADAAQILECAIAERVDDNDAGRARSSLVLAAATNLRSASVSAVARDLGVNERQMRRMFHDTVGMSPKAFAQLARFHRALRAARNDRGMSWATIAAAEGYYDQAHLIAEFRALAGVTPNALLDELRVSQIGAARRTP